MQDAIGTLWRGVAAGIIGSLVQAALGGTQSAVFLPDGENANLAPRLMGRLAARTGGTVSDVERWTLGTAYHLVYGAAWGVMYATLRERRHVHPALGGALLGGLIYGITFPNCGGAVKLDAERPPGVRSHRMNVVLYSVTLSFGLSTAYAYEWLRAPR